MHTSMAPADHASLLDLDWRFLLPLPRDGRFRHLLLLGASERVVQQLEGLGVADEVALEPGGQPDAIVCLQAARSHIREVAANLPRGAALYYEVDRLRAPRVAPGVASRRSLRRLGLSSTALYLVHPRFGGARSYVPLDIDGALRWYLSNLSTAPAAMSALLDHGARLMARLGPARVAAFTPRLAVVGIAHTDRDACPAIIEGAALRTPGRLRPLVLVRGDERSRVVMLPFASASREPLAVVKIDRRPVPEGKRQAEHAALEAVRSSLSTQMRETVPQPLAIVGHGPASAAVESFLDGEWLHAKWARRDVGLADLIGDLEAVAGWLAEFHTQSRLEVREWGVSDVHRWIEEPIGAYEDALGATTAEAQLFARARKSARAAIGLRLPIVWQHSDLSSLNVLRSGSIVRVVDWEAAAPGVPLDDLLYFTTRWLDRVRSGRRGERRSAGYRVAATALRHLFLEPRHHDPAVDAARRAIDRYVRMLELDDRFRPLLLLHAWVRRATGRLEREGRAGAARVSGREDNRYVAYVGELAANVDRVFNP
jgi:aminoglycoside phosphotransferase (APT) family kinase protein